MHNPRKILFAALFLLGVQAAVHAQDTVRTAPVWWFGGAIAENLNFYGGTTQMLNPSLTTPTPFHKGFGTGLYLAPLIEYRPDPVWGGMLQVGYDGRRGTFKDVTCPCGENATLSAKISYITVEPSLRVSPFSIPLYAYVGPRIGFNWAPNLSRDGRSFHYTQDFQPNTDGQFSNMRKTVFGAQIGMGYDIAFTPADRRTQVEFSPFIAYQPYLGNGPRTVENWAVSTLRIGVALKFGRGKIIHTDERTATTQNEVAFTVRAPRTVPAKRTVHENFPLRNYVFFEEGSTDVPARYVLLTKEQAGNFKEEQLEEVQPKNSTGRSLRQMTVYYNILNIIGDRMKRNPDTKIMLSGSSDKGPDDGKARAETIKLYLVNVFGIDESRIATEGRDKPKIPSEQPGGTKELDLLRIGDQRVDIESASPEMLVQVGGGSNFMLKPVAIVADEEDPLDSHVIFDVTGAKGAFTSWSIEVTDDHGVVQQYGPYTGDRATIPGNTILAGHPQGDFKVVLIGHRNDGTILRKESSIHLTRRDDALKNATRFSILFDFDQSKSAASYEKFLTEVVAPLIPDSGTVVIHGYTDNIGEDAYNENLSNERVADTRGIIERALSAKGRQGVTFETFGFGENAQYAPFDNNFPEERFYNRTVIIDIVPN